MKAVHSSHLALRFYQNDGWTKEELDCLFDRVEMAFPDDISPYFNADKPKIPISELVNSFSSITTWQNRKLEDKGLMANYVKEMTE